VSSPREVVIDARWLRTGIGRYILNLLQGLKQRLPDTVLSCITMSRYVETIAPLCDRVVEMNCDIYSVMEQVRLPSIARNASIFCAPHYNIPVLRRGPLVVTIHDLTHLLFAKYEARMGARLYAEPMLRLACARASRIVTPSDYTRRMLVDRLKARPEKISVIPCALSEIFQPWCKRAAAEKVRENHGLTKPYIIFVGSTAPHKNLENLLVAYQLLRARFRDIPELVLVLPQSPFKPGIGVRLRSLLAMPGVRCLHSVTDRAMASLYSAALMTVMPSFEEGFGLPVLESMACGTPVACSHAASLPEVARSAAVYFDPHSVEEMASAIEQLLHSEELQQRLVADGLRLAADYSIGRSASSYASMLVSIIGEKSWK
jgi:glycosyltransferase involved in cell wall biosynthesis